MKKLTLSLLTLSCVFQSALFAQDQEPLPPPAANGLWQTLFMVVIALAFFYLILLRPEQQRRKAMDQMRQSLKEGDKVTALGIVGTISKIQENTIILKMVDGSKIEVLKGAITEALPSQEETNKE